MKPNTLENGATISATEQQSWSTIALHPYVGWPGFKMTTTLNDRLEKSTVDSLLASMSHIIKCFHEQQDCEHHWRASLK